MRLVFQDAHCALMELLVKAVRIICMLTNSQNMIQQKGLNAKIVKVAAKNAIKMAALLVTMAFTKITLIKTVFNVQKTVKSVCRLCRIKMVLMLNASIVFKDFTHQRVSVQLVLRTVRNAMKKDARHALTAITLTLKQVRAPAA